MTDCNLEELQREKMFPIKRDWFEVQIIANEKHQYDTKVHEKPTWRSSVNNWVNFDKFQFEVDPAWSSLSAGQKPFEQSRGFRLGLMLSLFLSSVGQKNK